MGLIRFHYHYPVIDMIRGKGGSYDSKRQVGSDSQTF